MSRRNVLLINNVWGGRGEKKRKGIEGWIGGTDWTVSISRKRKWLEGEGAMFFINWTGLTGCLPSERQS